MDRAEIEELIDRLYPLQIGKVISAPTLDTQYVSHELLRIAAQSAEDQQDVIRALIKRIEDDADGGADAVFYMACDLLGQLKAIEAMDVLVKYLDYQPGRIGASLRYRPAVWGLIQIGEAAIPKITEALRSGRSKLHNNNDRLRHNAVTALLHIGGSRAKAALQTAFAHEPDDEVRQAILFAIRHIEMNEAEAKSEYTRVKPVEMQR